MKKCLKLLICFAVAILCGITVISSSVTASAASENDKWVAAWGTAPTKLDMTGMSAVGSLVGDVTVRVVITPTASGERFRVKISNVYGKGPLKINNITAARSKGNSKIDLASLKYITFNNGSPDVTVEAGKEIYSDPVALKVNAFEPIAISMFINEYQDVTTMGLSGATTYFTTGEATRTENYDLLLNVFDEQEMLDTVSKVLMGFGGTGSLDIKLAYSFMKFVPAIASLDVLTDASGYSVVVAGDSTVADNFPEYLAKAICQQNNISNVGVVGKGVVGNRLLTSGLGLGTQIDAASLLVRLERDILSESGVEYVIVKIGANDIIHPVSQDVLTQAPNTSQPTAESLINGYRRLFNACHDAGVKVIVASITQWKGHTRDYFEEGAQYVRTEAEFQADWQIAKDVNEWLASTDEHDGYVDLTEISANPLDKDALSPEYTTDGLHPSDICQKLWSSYFPGSLIGIGKKPGGVRMEKTLVETFVGEKTQIVANVIPETAENKNLFWASSNPDVATVDENGVVTAHSNGSAVITCETEVGFFKASCKVTVTTKPDKIMLNYTERDIYTTKSTTLEAIVYPETANDKSVKWSSSNTRIATVDQNGKVTGVGAGTAIITATTNVGGLTAKCFVNVTKKTAVQTITLSLDNETVTSKTLYTNGLSEITLSYNISPTSATFKDVIWTSTNPKVATVDPLGNVRAVSAGKTAIKCTSEDNPMVSGVCTITVKVIATGIELDKTSFKVYETKSKTLKATITPEDATNKNVIWSSSDNSIATVDKNGKVTGKTPGTVYISATTANGKHKAECKVTVQKMIYSKKVRLNKSTLTLEDGKSYILDATVLPENTTSKSVTWSSGNKKVATVDAYGDVTAVAPGTTYIYCKTKDTGVTAKCKVTVKEVKPTSVSFSSKTITIEYGETRTLKPTIKPSNVTDKSLTWTSSNPKVVKVTSAGKIKGLKAGSSAVITATTNTGKLTAKITVKVNPVTVSKITLNKTSLTLSKGKSSTLTATIKPANATNQTLTWTSSNTKVAKVSADGKVTAVKNGTATITCKAANGKTATCKVTVKNIPVTGFKLDKTWVRADKGAEFTLKATFEPSNATNKTIKWTTSDKSVATVSSSGKVTIVGKSSEVCQITATTVDGEFTAVCLIEVI
jgi:uncharacterized protein YjdB